MIDYTLLTAISIIALVLSIICVIFALCLNSYLEHLYECFEHLSDYVDILSDRTRKQRSDFNRSLLTTERKEKELDERITTLQCRLNQDRMQNIIDGKIIE